MLLIGRDVFWSLAGVVGRIKGLAFSDHRPARCNNFRAAAHQATFIDLSAARKRW